MAATFFDSHALRCKSDFLALGLIVSGTSQPSRCQAIRKHHAIEPQRTPLHQVPLDLVKFPPGWNLDIARQEYIKSPHNFIREVCRLDPPVTSATTSLKEDEEVRPIAWAQWPSRLVLDKQSTF
eukprot:scaffold348_cov31-Tisochrysis_lutea.AAC.3